MSIKNWPGGRISPTPPTPSGPYQDSTASGVWTLEQQAYWEAQNLWPTAGAVNPDVFIENLFQTWLYTGNGSTQTINNGIDLAGKGGLVWIKKRGPDATNHSLVDSARGVDQWLRSNTTEDQIGFSTNGLSPMVFNADGFRTSNYAEQAGNTNPFVAWTFRKQPKFFDVVTYTGTGANRTIAHNLGSVPGCIIVKRTDTTGDWQVYHRSLANTEYMVLNSTAVADIGATRWNSTTPTSTVFSLGTDATVNASGGTYVAYIYAHNAGGFGLSGADNVISCGSYTGNGSATGPIVSLGYEPQWLMIKRATGGTGNWQIIDNMRGIPVGSADATLQANLSNAESSVDYVSPTATGFQVVTTNAEVNTNASTYIYIAIRRGPMKVPETGTSVFAPAISTNNLPAWSTGFPVDMGIFGGRTGSDKMYNAARLMGETSQLKTNTTDAAANWLGNQRFDQMNGYGVASTWGTNYIGWMMRRAPGFFDVVCYTGTGSGAVQNVAHNLTVVPEMMIVKVRSASGDSWIVYHSATGNTRFLQLNSTAAFSTFGVWNNTTPTASVFTVGNDSSVNASGATYVNYLFASAPGVSKVGSYTGTGTTQTINCGFTGGARFVLIKSTSTTGDWLVWDTARGMIPSNDPYLRLNTNNAEVTGTDWVDTAATGFELSNAGGNLANSNGVSYIFLAIS